MMPPTADSIASPESLPRALRDALRLPDAGTRDVRIKNSFFSEIWLLTGMNHEDLVAKVFAFDPSWVIRANPDPRLLQLPHLVPVAPWFCSTREIVEGMRRVLTVEVPEIRFEGRVPDGRFFVVMSRLEGRPWNADLDRSPQAQAGISFALGRIARDLTRSRVADGILVGKAGAAYLHHLLHAFADHLDARVLHCLKGSACVHRAFDRLIRRMETAGFGASSWVHGDLHPSNLLIDDAGGVRGLVDFDLSIAGPPQMDCRWLDDLDGQAFADGYGVGSEDLPDLIWAGLFYRLFWDLLTMLMARHSGMVPVTDAVAAGWSAQIARLLDRLGDGPASRTQSADTRAEASVS